MEIELLSARQQTLQATARKRHSRYRWAPDKVRAKIQEVQLPENTRQPGLNTDFGNTITLLYALVRHFNEDVLKVVETIKARTPEGLEVRVHVFIIEFPLPLTQFSTRQDE